MGAVTPKYYFNNLGISPQVCEIPVLPKQQKLFVKSGWFFDPPSPTPSSHLGFAVLPLACASVFLKPLKKLKKGKAFSQFPYYWCVYTISIIIFTVNNNCI